MPGQSTFAFRLRDANAEVGFELTVDSRDLEKVPAASAHPGPVSSSELLTADQVLNP
jgi:hypothetical protein